MQAIIMAAGKGSRLGSLTEDKPKSFLEIKGIKLIEYNVGLLHASGIEDIIIVSGYMHRKIEDLYRSIKGITLVYNPFYEFTNVLGSFYMAQNILKEDKDIIYMHADTLCAPELLKKMMRQKGDVSLPIDFKLCDEEAMKVRIQNGRLIEISKEIDCEQADGEFIGIAKISKSILPALKNITVELLEKKLFNAYFEGAIDKLIKEKNYEFNIISTDGYFWGEIDFLEDYYNVEKNIPQKLIDIALMDRYYRGV